MTATIGNMDDKEFLAWLQKPNAKASVTEQCTAIVAQYEAMKESTRALFEANKKDEASVLAKYLLLDVKPLGKGYGIKTTEEGRELKATNPLIFVEATTTAGERKVFGMRFSKKFNEWRMTGNSAIFNGNRVFIGGVPDSVEYIEKV